MIPSALFLLLAAAAPVGAATTPATTDMVVVGPGTWRSLYAPGKTEDSADVEVGAFRLDRHPVTNADFLSFVVKSPRWRKGAAPGLFVDERYLEHWQGALRPGEDAPAKAPVIHVSWFAAKAYCESLGKRLPKEAEWELAASAGETTFEGKSEPGFNERILSWYASPTPKRMPDVGGRAANAWGVSDMHGLVWEWVLDYSSSFAPGDSRKADDDEPSRICGAGAVSATEKSDYAAFMRTAFRSSLEGRYTNGNLGFRCAKDVEE